MISGGCLQEKNTRKLFNKMLSYQLNFFTNSISDTWQQSIRALSKYLAYY